MMNDEKVFESGIKNCMNKLFGLKIRNKTKMRTNQYLINSKLFFLNANIGKVGR